MRFSSTPIAALLGGLMLTLLVTATVTAYSGEVAATVTVNAPSGAQACKAPITFTATVVDVNGKAIEGQPVTWSFTTGDVAGDSIADASTTTNATGVATTRATFMCARRSVTIGASADGITGSAVIDVAGDALPRTDTAPPETSSMSVILAALAVLLGCATILRRFAADRR